MSTESYTINEVTTYAKERDPDAARCWITDYPSLEDDEDVRTWDITGLCKWAMSAFSVSLSPSKVKHQSSQEIEEQLISAAAEQIDKKV